MNSLASFSHVVVSFAATYLLHSTVLLAACWIVIRGLDVTSHFLVERMWKLAAVLGLVTALMQIGSGIRPVINLAQFMSTETSNETAFVESPEQTSQAMSVPITGTQRSTGLSGNAPRSMANGEGLDVVIHDDAVRHNRTKNEAAAEELIGMPDLSAASGEPKDAYQIGRLEGSRSLSESALIADQINPIVNVPEIVVQTVSLAVTTTIAIGAFLLMWKSLRLRRKSLGACVLRDGPARHTLDHFLKRNRIRRHVQLLESSRYAEPFTYGLFGWTIVLPDCTDKRLGPDELKALLAHEVAHLVRGDAYWLWIGQLLCTCLAFQPLNFIARRRWQQAAEYLCDDWAVERGIRSLSLASCLTQIAEWRFGTQRCPVGLAAGGTKATLVQRIERLIEARKRTDSWAKPVSRRIVNSAAVLCSAMLIAFAPRVALPHSPEASARTRSEFQENSDAESLRRPLPEQAWESLQQELFQLEADVERATHLMKSIPRYAGAEQLMGDIRQRTVLLRARREKISLALGKESE